MISKDLKQQRHQFLSFSLTVLLCQGKGEFNVLCSNLYMEERALQSQKVPSCKVM